MVFKFTAFAALLALAQAGVVPGPYAAPVAYAPQQLLAKVAGPYAVKQVEEYDPNVQYSYGYEVHDGLTGDSKSQQESRQGDAVEGSYSLIDADGFKRTVHYTADAVHGFNAVVHREPLAQKALVAKTVAAPVAYAAPVAKYAYAAPVAKYASPVSYAAPLSYSAPVVAKTYAHTAPLGYSAYAQPAPLAYSSPVVTKTYAQPASYAYSAPVAHAPSYAYSSAPLVSKSYSSPVAYSSYHH